MVADVRAPTSATTVHIASWVRAGSAVPANRRRSCVATGNAPVSDGAVQLTDMLVLDAACAATSVGAPGGSSTFGTSTVTAMVPSMTKSFSAARSASLPGR